MSSDRRFVPAMLAALTASALLLGGAPHAQATADQRNAFPDVIALPDGFRPEGIAIRGTTAYFGSLADGDLYAADLVSGQGRIISEGSGSPSVGLTIDQRDRLFVAGGATGEARVVAAGTGEILATYTFTAPPSFINDVVLTPETAWFTDSANPVLYGLPLSKNGALPDVAEVIVLPLGGDYEHVAGFNLNGITRTPDGSALLAVHSTSGMLYRIDTASGDATVVDLGGHVLPNGDGLLLRGRTLYVVQNRLNQVAVVALDRAGTSGTVTDVLTSPAFDVPTTVAAHGSGLYLPNARFTTPPTSTTPYTAVRIDG